MTKRPGIGGTIGALLGGTLLTLLPALPAHASAPAARSEHCATPAQYRTVHDGQTIPEVRRELGPPSDRNGGVTAGHGRHVRTYAPYWRMCSAAGDARIGYGIDFQGTGGHRLRVDDKGVVVDDRLG